MIRGMRALSEATSAPAPAPGSLRERLEFILVHYEEARAHAFSGRKHPVWQAFRALEHNLSLQSAVRDRHTLEIAWSAGQKSLLKIPWLALLDRREARNRQEGVYCGFLFRQDMTGVYLTLNQGIAKLKREVGRDVARARLRERTGELRLLCSDLTERGFRLDDLMDLRADPALSADYDYTTVAYKLYEAGTLPPDEVITEDLAAVLDSYDRCLAAKDGYSPRSRPALVREQGRDEQRRAFERGPAVEALIEYIGARGFVFEPWQVAAYVTALRTKPFVILAGVTGTGKSKLPALVTEATGGASRLLPVRPDWTDSADLLGYTDLQGAFRPGALLDVARTAMEQPDRHWVCILDEMNLARVEHFFAEVLSRIEDRRMSGGGGFASDPLLSPTLRADAQWSAVALPANLAVVGTVNMDESAHGFSRKVLDRAFTLELSDVDLALWQLAREPAEPAHWPASAWFPRATRLGELQGVTEAEDASIGWTIETLTEVNGFLAPAGLQVGYRTRDEVALFVLHAFDLASSFVTRSGAPVDPLDLALHMKVLPRIVGGSGAVRRALLGMLGWAHGGRPLTSEAEAKSVLAAWDDAGRIGALPGSRFPRTAARLCLMWERLLAEGFTSFWL